MRSGLPRLAARLRAGSARIVAFGSSITHDGYYLEPLVPALTARFPGADVDVLARALPGYMSYWAVHRAPGIAALEPDAVIVEFAVNDFCLRNPEGVARAVEGIVRRLRSTSPAPDILFVYFMSRLIEALPHQAPVLAAWESVAEHYGVPSIDCSRLAEELVNARRADWIERWPGRSSWEERERRVVLTRDLTHHTLAGGRVFGEHFARAVVELLADSAPARNGQPVPLDAAHFADARAYFPQDLLTSGWSVRRLDDNVSSNLTIMYFRELLVPDAIGARLKLNFTGRHVAIWGHSAAANVIAFDGQSAAFHLPDPRMALPAAIYQANENSTHALEFEVRELPFEIGAIDVLGSLEVL